MILNDFSSWSELRTRMYFNSTNNLATPELCPNRAKTPAHIMAIASAAELTSPATHCEVANLAQKVSPAAKQNQAKDGHDSETSTRLTRQCGRLWRRERVKYEILT